MFGRLGVVLGGGAVGAAALAGPVSLPVASASRAIPRPAPASSPPAAAPRLMKVRLSTLLSCSGPMLSMRALIVGLTTALWAASAAAASVAAGGPTWGTPTLNTSAVKAGSVTVSPLSGSRDATPRTQISFLGVPARDLSHVLVSGSQSGTHAGRMLAYS